MQFEADEENNLRLIEYKLKIILPKSNKEMCYM